MKIEWTIDSSGQMRGFSYHDGSLETLEWVKDRYIRMRIATVDGSINVVELCNIDAAALQLWEGAIIAEPEWGPLHPNSTDRKQKARTRLRNPDQLRRSSVAPPAPLGVQNSETLTAAG